VAPVLEVRRLAGPAPDLEGVGALAFTSRNAVAAFAAISSERALPAFAVGEATARAARDAGFAKVHSADGDVDALAAAILDQRASFRGLVLHAGAAEPAGDLAAALQRGGVGARLCPVYATVASDPPIAAFAALSARPVELDAVLVHSPAAARRLAGFTELHRAAQHLHAFCISAAAGEPLHNLNFRRVAVAPLPNETSLLNLIAR